MAVEVHNMPSNKARTGTLYQFDSDGVLGSGISIANLVFYNTSGGNLETGTLGTVYKIQISTSQLSVSLKKSDKIEIDGVMYRMDSPVLKDNNPVFVDFWQSEIKTVK